MTDQRFEAFLKIYRETSLFSDLLTEAEFRKFAGKAYRSIDAELVNTGTVTSLETDSQPPHLSDNKR